MKNPSPTALGEVQAECFCMWKMGTKPLTRQLQKEQKYCYSVEEQFWGDRHEVLKIQLYTDGQYQPVSDLSRRDGKSRRRSNVKICEKKTD